MNELVIRHSESVTRCGPFSANRNGLVVDGEPSFEQWQEFGGYLQHVAGSVQWVIGDWLNYGEKKYGETYAQAIELTGLGEDSLRQMKWVSSRFESVRRLTLSFGHHAAVAALPPDCADEILNRASSNSLSVREVKQIAKQAKNSPAAELDEGDEFCTVKDLDTLAERGLKFGTIVADPPWAYDNHGTRGATKNHYENMTIAELCELPVNQLAADKSHLWLWTTNAFIFECPKIFDAWGYEFKSSYIWVKPQIGIGNYFRNSHEFLLLGVRGGLTSAATDIKSWGQFDRTRHSEKPDEIRTQVIERTSPGPRLELFGRKVAPGWVVWGDQVSSTLFGSAAREIQ